MHLVATTKALIQKLREDGWESLVGEVKLFCERYEIEIPDMSARYSASRGPPRNQQNHITIEHHYRIDIFTVAIDSQLQELNHRFSEQAMELLNLSSSLDPKSAYNSLKIDDICTLVEKFYPQDFTEQERIRLKFQLQHFELDVPHHPDLQNLSTISELCQGLVETGKSKTYHLVHRLILLILTLLVSTATTERAFSAMNIVKTSLRNKKEDEFLTDCLVVYIEKEIAENFSSEMIIDDFYSLKHRRAQL